ncbi:hypothetical protein P691DRAFT_43747 [Macrolepiota fuliginosa MF-IS2]|uniref:Uncharacterized protein n=1 Tax=Macrolepiota fuliginosa MF-IS2 TaxID=1400762 RepID=A0A9P5XN54_9AGAR|nr:hypothetical protein P691DRAFT_43747 [Macrolepiota fuliginosa MF-IS2]
MSGVSEMKLGVLERYTFISLIIVLVLLCQLLSWPWKSYYRGNLCRHPISSPNATHACAQTSGNNA